MPSWHRAKKKGVIGYGVYSDWTKWVIIQKPYHQKYKKRYFEKLKCLGFTNLVSDDQSFPWNATKSRGKKDFSLEPPLWSDDNTKWPSVEFGAIYVYLIDTPGPLTRHNLQAYKSLDAYGYFIDRWVQTCYMWTSETGSYSIIKAKVSRSQAVREKPHEAWVTVRMKDGVIECGHCNCMSRYVLSTSAVVISE